MSKTAHRIDSLDALREIIGHPGDKTEWKICRALDATAVEFISNSPFFLLATVDAQGRPDVSPKGDPPGFVVVEDENTLLIPERPGNKLVFGLQNILADPRVALIFLVPGTEETLRVQGTAELSSDPVLCTRLSERGRPALLVLRVRVERCFFHCAKAFKRAQLWQPETWPSRVKVSFGRIIATNMAADVSVAEEIDRYVEEVSYKKNL